MFTDFFYIEDLSVLIRENPCLINSRKSRRGDLGDMKGETEYLIRLGLFDRYRHEHIIERKESIFPPYIIRSPRSFE